jgi:Tol biopolymer transport system component
VARFNLRLPEPTGLATFASASLAIAPDGRTLAYVADEGGETALFVRALDAEEPLRIRGSEGARSPFFSPDGEWLAFGAAGKLKKVWLRGGRVHVICEAPMFYGGAWGADGVIVFLPWFARGLWRVPADGGRPSALTVVTGDERAHLWPQFLPDGRTLLFTIWMGGSFDSAAVAVRTLATGEQRIVHRGGTYARFAAPGTLLVVQAGALLAMPFSLDTRSVTGVSRPVLEDVLVNGNSGAAFYAVSRDGTLVYARGGPRMPERRLVWVTRTGEARPATAATEAFTSPRLSRDGRRVALWLQRSDVDVWLLDTSRDTLDRVSYGKDDHSPVWSPDGLTIAYDSSRDRHYNLWARRSDGVGGEWRITDVATDQFANDWSADGRWLIATEFNPDTGADLVRLDPRGRQAPQTVLRTAYAEGEASLSPDGRLIAYVSDESDRPEVYVRSLDGAGSGLKVSTMGGDEPAWSAAGRELYYRAGARMMASTITTSGPALHASRPVGLFDGRYHRNLYPTRSYDVARDGRFLMVEDPPSPHRTITVVLGWGRSITYP